MMTHESFIETLKDVKNVSDHYALIDSYAAQGKSDILRDLFLKTRECHSLAPSEWASHAVCERIIETLALTDRYDNAMTALELTQLAKTEDSPHINLAAVISKIVAGQTPETIGRLLDSKLDIESFALILHESIIRRKLPPDPHSTQNTGDFLESKKHPLSVLPLTLLDIESSISLPHYQSGSCSTNIPFGPFENEKNDHPTQQDNGISVTETTAPKRAHLISTAVINWEEKSAGEIEARTFTVNNPTGTPSLSPILRNIGLACIGPLDSAVFLEDQPVADVFSILFAAASSGGAYSNGEYAAYGRLSAWHSLAGLVAYDESIRPEDIMACATACKWCIFSADNDWFKQVAWDIGIACFNPKQNELAILAATDTD